MLEARVGLVRGHLTLKAGDVVEMREDAAVHATFHKLVEPIDPFTAVGRETLALLLRSVFTPSYEKVAARHRQKAAPPGRIAGQGPDEDHHRSRRPEAGQG